MEHNSARWFYVFVKGGKARVIPDDAPDVWALEDEGWEFVWDSARTEEEGYAFARARHNASPEGDPLPSLIDTAGFRQWFGQSKCVDNRGKPLRVFHGSPRTYDRFKYIEPDGPGGAGWGFNRIGFWFDVNPKTANAFAHGEGGNVQPVYLSMQNPLVLQDAPIDPAAMATMHKARKGFQAADEANRLLNDDSTDMRRHEALRAYEAAKQAVVGRSMEPFNQLMSLLPKYDRKSSPEVRKGHTASVAKIQAALMAKGYDGIILRNTMADAGSRGWEPSDWFIVFRPNQIKSAVSNSGRFDPSDERLGESASSRRRGKVVEDAAGDLDRVLDARGAWSKFTSWLRLHNAETPLEDCGMQSIRTRDDDIWMISTKELGIDLPQAYLGIGWRRGVPTETKAYVTRGWDEGKMFSLLVLLVHDDPRTASEITWSLSMSHFIHEWAHLIEYSRGYSRHKANMDRALAKPPRRPANRTREEKLKAYWNSPIEFNGYFQQGLEAIVNNLQMSARRDQDAFRDKYLKDFASFFRFCRIDFDYDWIQNLNEDRQKRLKKRVFLFYQIVKTQWPDLDVLQRIKRESEAAIAKWHAENPD